MTWSLADIGDQNGRTVVVTGPSLGGLGYFTALELARRGALVVLCGRTPAKLDEAELAILAEVPDASLRSVIVDLASLESVRTAATEMADLDSIDVLINNAGIMASPFRRTVDGFESQMATNHFGPFLFTGLLFDSILAASGRVVTVSSQMHRIAWSAPLGDPRVKPSPYLRWREYGRSKLANLLFTLELQRRCDSLGLPVSALAAHPGVAGTHLMVNGQATLPGISIMDAATKAISQSPAAGALPTLMAATADLPGGTYCGPSGPGQMSGPPKVVGTSSLAADESVAKALWSLSEETVGLEWPAR
ncbi:MAG: oxidoreductase [Nocardioides sp.]|jgi:NAD(P)-dependent dehydrogenase (short-subunit alcohol dehydrogenase family)